MSFLACWMLQSGGRTCASAVIKTRQGGLLTAGGTEGCFLRIPLAALLNRPRPRLLRRRCPALRLQGREPEPRSRPRHGEERAAHLQALPAAQSDQEGGGAAPAGRHRAFPRQAVDDAVGPQLPPQRPICRRCQQPRKDCQGTPEGACNAGALGQGERPPQGGGHHSRQARAVLLGELPDGWFRGGREPDTNPASDKGRWAFRRSSSKPSPRPWRASFPRQRTLRGRRRCGRRDEKTTPSPRGSAGRNAAQSAGSVRNL